MDSKSRGEFLEGFKPGGKYAGAVGIYRHNDSSKHIGVFDAELIKALPDSLGWIAHNGAGYDQIDVAACRERGKRTNHFVHIASTFYQSDHLSSCAHKGSWYQTRQAQSMTQPQRPLCT